MRTRTAVAGAGVLPVVAATAGYLRLAQRRSRVDWTAPTDAVEDGPLAVRSRGSGGVPILLLHGLAASNGYWGAVFDGLSVEGRLVVPDLLGFGASPKPAHGYGPDEHADAVAACLREACGSDTAAVVGAHSTGCLVALHLARRHPELVRAVVAFAPPLYANREDARAHIAKLGLMERLFALETPLAHSVCRWVCDHRSAAARLAVFLRPDLPGAVARDAVRHTWASYSETVRDVLLGGSGIGVLDELTVPVRFVIGLDDAIPDRRRLERAAATHPNVSLAEWSGADHQLLLTNPTRAVAELRSARDSVRVDQG